MSERDAGFPASRGFSASTENSASFDSGGPDASRSTAEFRAFASRTGENEPPWRMRAPGRRVALLAGIVVAVAVVLAVIAIFVLNS